MKLKSLLFLAAMNLANAGQPVDDSLNRIGILWTTWHPSHYQNYEEYVDEMESWGINYVSLNPTWFIDTYAEGIIDTFETNPTTPSAELQTEVVEELIGRGFFINYRPHIDPIKYGMPLGDMRDNWATTPGGDDWRGKFDLLDPTSPSIGYMETVVLPGLDIIASAIRNAGPPVRPIRFDLGAELMDSMLNYPTHWQDVLATVRAELAGQYSDVAAHISLGHNFCHHIEYLLRLPGHEAYMKRINANLALDPENQFLDRPGVTQATRLAIGQYIAGLDELSISQYMPLDLLSPTGDPLDTTPEMVRQTLIEHETNFINEVLLGELGIDPDDLPILHIGEYGMGIRGLSAPNVWDAADWIAQGNGDLLLSDDVQKAHAAIAMDGIIQYVNSPETQNRSFLIWMGGAPYDVLGINPYSEGWFNEDAANALETYWTDHPDVLPVGADPALPLYQVTASAGTGGSISPSGIVNIAQGCDRTFSISVLPGYTITDVLIDSVSVGSADEHTLTSVNADATIEVQFSGSLEHIPVARAGAEQRLFDTESDGSVTATLDASASSDEDGDPLGYLWEINGTTIGTTAIIQTPLPLGLTTATLTVSDGTYSHSDTVEINVITPLWAGVHDEEEYLYSGDWSSDNSGGDKLNGDDRYSGNSGDFYELFVVGSYVEIYGTIASHHGDALISIDGGPAQTVSFQNSSRDEQALIWTSPALDPNVVHTIRVSAAGDGVITADRVVIGSSGPPVITGITQVSTGIRLRGHGSAGLGYRITTSSDLISWNPLSTGTFSIATLEFIDTTAPSAPRQFYRIEYSN